MTARLPPPDRRRAPGQGASSTGGTGGRSLSGRLRRHPTSPALWCGILWPWSPGSTRQRPGADQRRANRLGGGHGHRRSDGAHGAGEDHGEPQRERCPERLDEGDQRGPALGPQGAQVELRRCPAHGGHGQQARGPRCPGPRRRARTAPTRPERTRRAARAHGSRTSAIFRSAVRQLTASAAASNAPSTVSDMAMLMPIMSTMPTITQAM